MIQVFRYIILCSFICSLTLSSPYPYTYTDDKGYKTVIAKKPSRIVVAGGMWPMPSVIIMLEQSVKSLIYIPKASQNALKHTFIGKIFPEIANIKSGESENIEELLGLNPDLFICHSANVKLCDNMKKSGVPTIDMNVVAWNYDSFLTLKGWLEQIAPLLDKQKEAQAFLRFCKQMEQDIESKIAKESQKPKAIIIHNFDSDKSFSIGGFFASYLLEKSGASNAITNKNTVKMSLEEVYVLNPDIIYINNFNTLMPKDLLQSPLWQNLSAVKQKRVYKFPIGSYRPFAPSVDLPILLKWLYEHNYPQNADKKALLEFTDNVYKTYFNLMLSDEELQSIFTPNKEAGQIK